MLRLSLYGFFTQIKYQDTSLLSSKLNQQHSTRFDTPLALVLTMLCCMLVVLSACNNINNPSVAVLAKGEVQETATSSPFSEETPIPILEASPLPTEIADPVQSSLEDEKEEQSTEQELAPSEESTPVSISAADFDGETMDKITAAQFLNEGKEVTVIGVGPDYFEVKLKTGENIRIISPVKPKYYERFIDEYGLSDVRITNGYEVGYEGILKSSTAPKAIMGVGPNVIGVTPMASDGILVNEVSPLFTLSTPLVTGPNDITITEEMDYDPKNLEASLDKRWLEIFRGFTNGKIWTIFEQSNRYFTNVDKREWDRLPPGKVFSMMQQFEYLINIPERIVSIRNPKSRSTEEKLKDRYILHDYSVQDISIRLLIPTLEEWDTATYLKKTSQTDALVSYRSIETVLDDDEMGDGEKFTWNNPIKIILVIDGKEMMVYTPTQSIIEINGEMYKLPVNLIN